MQRRQFSLNSYEQIFLIWQLVSSSDQDILFSYRFIRPILNLQQHGAGLQGFQVVPLAGGDVDEGATRDHVDGLRHPPSGIVEVLHEMPSQAHHRFRGGPVPMDG